MTDLEEKAKEYAKNFIYTINESADDRCKKAYKDGFNAGAEEVENAHQEEIENLYKSYADRLNQLQTKYDELKKEYIQTEKEYAELKIKYAELNDFSNSQCAKLLKENAELKAELETAQECIVQQQKEYEKLDKKYTEWFTKYHEQIVTVSEQKKQIEKMKNMQNCKHNWETKGHCIWKNGGYCVCKMWELAE